MQTVTPLLRISLDGEVVAQSMLEIFDGPAAWRAFCKGFEWVAPMVVYNELMNTMRVACDPGLLAEQGPQGIAIELVSSSLGLEVG